MANNSENLGIQKAFNDYFIALGKFIHQFSQVESLVQYLLRKESCVSWKIAPAIFSDIDVNLAQVMIKRIRSIKRAEIDHRLEKAFSQLDTINHKRNDVLYYGATYNNNVFQVNDAARKDVPEMRQTFRVDPAVLDNMTTDLQTISAVIWICVLELERQENGSCINEDDTIRIASMEEVANSSWKYIPDEY